MSRGLTALARIKPDNVENCCKTITSKSTKQAITENSHKSLSIVQRGGQNLMYIVATTYLNLKMYISEYLAKNLMTV